MASFYAEDFLKQLYTSKLFLFNSNNYLYTYIIILFEVFLSYKKNELCPEYDIKHLLIRLEKC